jgi:hypothetical protein
VTGSGQTIIDQNRHPASDAGFLLTACDTDSGTKRPGSG